MFAPEHILEIVALGAGAVLMIAGLALLASGLFRDRSRGRRRCGRCWYSMDGITGLTCPECGRSARSERQLLRTRRRWRRAGAGLAAIAIAIALAVTPAVRRHGPESLIPTTAAIALLPRLDHAYAGQLVTSRMDAGLWVWQERWLASNCLMLLDSPDVERRRAGAELLQALSPQALPARAMARRLADRDVMVRDALSWALRQRAITTPMNIDSDAAALMAAAVISDVDFEIGQRIGEALGYCGEPGLAALQEVLRHDDPLVRARAMRGLGKLAEDSEQAVEMLIAAMEDKHHYVRQKAATAATAAVHPTSFPRLIEALRELEHDPHWLVRTAATVRRRDLEKEAYLTGAAPFQPHGQ